MVSDPDHPKGSTHAGNLWPERVEAEGWPLESRSLIPCVNQSDGLAAQSGSQIMNGQSSKARRRNSHLQVGAEEFKGLDCLQMAETKCSKMQQIRADRNNS